MSNKIINHEHFNYANQIAKLLDSKETSDGTKGDNKIDISIWNKFYGGNDKTDSNSINFLNASVMIYNLLKNNGIDHVKNMLKNVGIDWNPKIESPEAGSNNQNDTNSTTDTKQLSEMPFTQAEFDRLKAQSEERKKAQEEIKAKRQEERNEIAETKEASNGLTYNKATKIISSIEKKYVFDVSIPETLPIEEKLKIAIKTNKAVAEPKPYLKEQTARMEADLKEAENARAAMIELENEYPVLKSSQKLIEEFFSQYSYEDINIQ